MGAGNSKSAAVDAAAAPQNGASDNGSRSKAEAVRDEAIGMVIDGIVLYGMYVTATFLYKTLKPMFEEFREGKGNKSKLQRRLDRTGRKMFHTNHYEEIIAGDIVDPHDIDVSFADIGGLEHQKRDIHDLIVLPLKNPAFFASRGKLLKAPKGILLYGKPGTGKTMLAKAIAKESGAFFIDLKISTIMSKWFGESQKLVRAAFSLAQKLAPCIIFIDEVDSFMGKRGGTSDPTFASMKTEFLALWDGFTEMNNTESGFGVIVMGATNRPGDVDPAFLRRMPRTFEIGLPDQHQREQILRINLKNETVGREFNFRQLSADTVYYSGSDLKELCRAALMIPLREHIEEVKRAPMQMPSGLEGEIATEPEIAMRPLSMADFEEAKQMVQPTGATAYAYEASQEDGKPQSRPGNTPIDMDLFAAIMAAGLQNMMQFSNQQNNHRHTQ
uniref:AAA+ ATPase domain-containing protein n=1 Tax=Globisporangium ultimum (strain ATCC 200006 / CBS 805.95 / DAOM BR144) TaxID=431595 RepID=K3WHB7_GLOUD